MSINVAFALIVVLITIYALIKRYETRCVLLASGFAMAMMRDDLVIEASNCWNAIIGFKENIAIAKPEAKRTHRVS